MLTVHGAPHVRSALISSRPLRLCSVLQRHDASVAGTPAFSWLAAAGANAYQFEYDDDPGFGSPNYTSAVLTTLTHKPPTIQLGSFYWHVRSRDAAGNWIVGWSAPRMITITPPKPVAPLLASPLNASFTNDSTPTFTWNSVPYGETYQIQISITSAFTGTLAADFTASELSYTPPISLADAKYYWRVRAFNSADVFSSWSAVRSRQYRYCAAPSACAQFSSTQYICSWHTRLLMAGSRGCECLPV